MLRASPTGFVVSRTVHCPSSSRVKRSEYPREPTTVSRSPTTPSMMSPVAPRGVMTPSATAAITSWAVTASASSRVICCIRAARSADARSAAARSASRRCRSVVSVM